MKTLVIVLGIILFVGFGLLFLIPAPASAPETPTTNSQMKIDISAICDGALAYMSFPNGAEADAWVAACKRGEHPEAIEQWKQMNGITDDRAI